MNRLAWWRCCVYLNSRWLNHIMKFYAVKVGRKPGVYQEWSECKHNVEGFPQAKYRKFDNIADAMKFVGGNKSQRPEIITLSPDKDVRPSTSVLHNEGARDRFQKRELVYEAVPVKNEFPVKHCTCVCKCGAFPNIPLTSIAISDALTKRTNDAQNELEPQRKILKTHPTVPRTTMAQQPPPDLLSLNSAPVKVYTDGACAANGRINSHGGIGVYWGPGHPLNVSEPLLGRQTNNRAEIMAAVRALQQAKREGIRNIALYTDSQFLINGITKWIFKWKRNGWKLVNGGDVINREDFEALDEAQKGLNVQYKYVKGHRGDPGNEAADSLAVQARDRNV